MGELPLGELVSSSAGARLLRDPEFLEPAKEITFGEIIHSPGGVDSILGSEFTKHFCEKKVLHIAQDDRNRFEHLFSWDFINRTLSQSLLDRKRLRLTRDGREIPPGLYRDDSKERDPVIWAKLRDLLKQNASVVMNRIQDLSPPVRRLAAQMEVALNQKLNVNGYMTFGAGGAFAMHYDPHDVLVLQIYGTKHWFIYEDPEPLPTYEDKKKAAKPAPREVAFETILQPGDVLYVPRGFYHRAAVTDTDSVHLTFGIHTVRGVDFVDWIASELAPKDILFRDDILTPRGSDSLVEQERAMKARLCEIVNGASLSDFIDKCLAERKPFEEFQLGPRPELSEDTLFAPLVRQRDAWRRHLEKTGKTPSAEVESILTFLIDNPQSTAGEIRRGLGNLLDQDALNAILAGLVDDSWIEIVR